MCAHIAINDVDDPRVDDYRNVKDRHLRDRAGLFLAESELVVQRLLRSRFTVRSLLLHPQRAERILPALAERADAPTVLVAAAPVLDAIAGFPVHRGVLALAERGEQPSLDALFALGQPLLALEDVGDPDNLGSLFRSAGAFGYGGVLLSPGCADPLYRKAIRSSMAATLVVPFAFVADWPASLVRSGRQVVALTPDVSASPLARLDCRPDHILVAGAEGPGLHPDTLVLASHRATIPMPRALEADDLDSLNVAVATAIAMYELRGRS